MALPCTARDGLGQYRLVRCACLALALVFVAVLGACGSNSAALEEGSPSSAGYAGVRACKDVDPSWSELVVDGAAPNGPANDAALSVVIANSNGYRLDWNSASIGVDAVLVNGGDVEGVRYSYPNESTFGNNLKSPEGFTGPGGAMEPRLISSVSFCYDGNSPTTTPPTTGAPATTPAPTTPAPTTKPAPR